MNVLDLFSGIGGFSLGLERAGMRTVAFCEIEPFARRVLAKHWPHVPCYDDVRNLTADRLRADGIAADVICGGFPCQDLSTAGKQAGIEAARSGLWSELCRIIGEVGPRYAVVENVSNLLSGPSERPGQWFGVVLRDLARIGYDAEWYCIRASDVGARHLRNRVWIVAYPQCQRLRSGRHRSPTGTPGEIREEVRQQWLRPDAQSGSEAMANTTGERCGEARQHRERCQERSAGSGEILGDTDRQGLAEVQGSEAQPERARFGATLYSSLRGRGDDIWSSEPDVGRVADGVPFRVDRLRGLGNSVVPQIPEIIGRAIMMHAQQTTPFALSAEEHERRS